MRPIIVAFVALTMVSLTACQQQPAATPHTAAPVSTPSPAPAKAEAPHPVVGVDCAGLVTGALLSSVFTTPPTLLPTVENVGLSSNVGPVGFSLRQLGGLQCEWSNGKPSQTGNGSVVPDFVGVIVRVLPNATTQWLAFAKYYSVSGTEYVECSPRNGATSPAACTVDALVGSTWVSVELQGVAPTEQTNGGVEAAAAPLYDHVIAMVTAAHPVANTWTPPAGTAPLKGTCEQFFTSADVQSLLGTSRPLDLGWFDGGMSLIGSTWVGAQALPCPWVWADDTPQGVGGRHALLPGGEWAWDETLAAAPAGSYEPVSPTGLAAGDRAFLSCASSAIDCTIDLVIDHNWVEISLSRDGEYGLPDPKPLVMALASKTVENLAS